MSFKHGKQKNFVSNSKTGAIAIKHCQYNKQNAGSKKKV